jgi:hypothetical protein
VTFDDLWLCKSGWFTSYRTKSAQAVPGITRRAIAGARPLPVGGAIDVIG